MGQEAIEDLSRSQEEGLIERITVKDVSSLKKKGFSRREKHIEINVTSKLLKQRSNQHVKHSKHLSTHMQSIDPKTHTHTLNKSN